MGGGRTPGGKLPGGRTTGENRLPFGRGPLAIISLMRRTASESHW